LSLLCGPLLGLLLAFAPLVQAERVVRIGTGDWVPYVDQHREDAGALARLISAVFAEAGYRVEYIFYPWDRNVLMLQQGALDAIMPYSCSPMRLDYGVCSEPLVRGEVVLFHRKDQPFDWKRIEDLKPYRIGTTLGYSYGTQFDGALQDGLLRIEQNSKEDTAFRLLELKRIDLHPQDRAVGYSMLRRLFPGEQAITHHPRYLNTESLRLLFRKDDPAAEELLRRFNEELARFAQRGELKRLQEALYRGEPDRWYPTSL
jgi:polar amino acid transport system substrate-binding protein